ncbi:HepT-like ribonuclease domain-containing protein [Methanoculleus receptaculi]|uniref:HepT-like ribonuclease domain-containing protein n=1 Tax=Methanoculleus receptaculi TaxID=394967 RepID=A0AAX4FTJ5_9EURY|nr:HepT-like ribonuclease domain-containing protein [Methanoculleus receptaculi]WOX57090.1 HepT-like ribonuclease domain-containing protein [Methanoculleus receptaculi]
MRSHTLYLSDLAAALEKIEEFTAGMIYDQFLHDDRTQSAVIRKFEIIGEAARFRCPSGRSIPPFPGARWRGCGIN